MCKKFLLSSFHDWIWDVEETNGWGTLSWRHWLLSALPLPLSLFLFSVTPASIRFQVNPSSSLLHKLQQSLHSDQSSNGRNAILIDHHQSRMTRSKVPSIRFWLIQPTPFNWPRVTRGKSWNSLIHLDSIQSWWLPFFSSRLQCECLWDLILLFNLISLYPEWLKSNPVQFNSIQPPLIKKVMNDSGFRDIFDSIKLLSFLKVSQLEMSGFWVAAFSLENRKSNVSSVRVRTVEQNLNRSSLLSVRCIGNRWRWRSSVQTRRNLKDSPK